MDEFICQCEGLGDVDTDTMILGLKRKFPDDLSHVCILPDAVERRVQALELMDNDYFKLGMQAAVKKAEEAGFKLPPMNFNQYAKKESDDVGNITLSFLMRLIPYRTSVFTCANRKILKTSTAG